MFRRRYRRRTFFPFWIIFILFFLFSGKAGFFAWLFPFFLIWLVGPLVWSLSDAGRKWTNNRDWEPIHNPIPPQWQTPQPIPSHPSRNPAPRPTPQASRSTVGLPAACPACGGPIDATTLDWRTNTPHCGYCGTNLK
ncbi:MAG: hypothetical protein H6636_13455 [Anaerolineales bacterium]|nr:hypothetical protein [Anaerolineales bacterium]